MSDNITLRLDRSKPHSGVHGERTPEDPHYAVHYMQDGLPFDAEGELVPDDTSKTDRWQGLNTEGAPVWYYPLYNKDMRDKLARKLARLAGVQKGGEPVQSDEDIAAAAREVAADDVNLESFLRGTANYEPWLVYAAAKKRYHKSYQKMRDVVLDLVLDEKLVPEGALAERFRPYLDGQAA